VRRNEVVAFRLEPDDLGSIRFGISPGYELCHAVRVLQRPAAHPLQWGWLRMVRDDLPIAALQVLTTVISPAGYFPDFLTTQPAGPLTPAAELTALRAARLDGVRTDLAKVRDRASGARRARVEQMLAAPEQARALIADAWEELWDRLLAPHWDALHRLLTADVAHRSRVIATEGMGAMVSGLHERVSWRPDEVRVRMRHWTETVICAGRGLLLVPSVLSHPGCAVLTEKPAQPTLFYPAQGITESWTRGHADTHRAIAELMGESRARVLGALDVPRTTTETAENCGLAISTTSRHLALLRNAGLVMTTRRNPYAVHNRTALGDALLAPSPPWPDRSEHVRR
jgi:hypothetical protein